MLEEELDYSGVFLDSVYNSVEDAFARTGSLSQQNVPLEFIAFVREALNKYFSENPSEDIAFFDELELPEMDKIPAVMTQMAARRSGQGYRVIDAYDAIGSDDVKLDIDITIPPEDQLYGEIADAPYDMNSEYPKFPTAIVSDERVGMMNQTLENFFPKKVQ